MCVCIPPKISVSSFMGYLKGKSALMVYDRHPELQNKWNKEFWARGYYVVTVGNITEEAIKKYIREQSEESSLLIKSQEKLKIIVKKSREGDSKKSITNRPPHIRQSVKKVRKSRIIQQAKAKQGTPSPVHNRCAETYWLLLSYRQDRACPPNVFYP